MSKMVLGGTLVSDPGDRGARSLGEVHLRAMSLLLKSDAENLADTIRRDLFVPLVRANLGDRAPVPFIAFGVEPPADAKERAERLKLYMDQGLRVPAEWIYDAEGIPSPQPGDVTIGGTGAAVMPRADAPPAEPPPVEE
jgi:phage gp29-like protein